MKAPEGWRTEGLGWFWDLESEADVCTVSFEVRRAEGGCTGAMPWRWTARLDHWPLASGAEVRSAMHRLDGEAATEDEARAAAEAAGVKLIERETGGRVAA